MAFKPHLRLIMLLFLLKLPGVKWPNFLWMTLRCVISSTLI